MAVEELSSEEENRLYALSCIPLFVFFLFLAAYFVYLMHNNLLKSVLDVFLRIGLLLLTVMPTIIFLTFEVFYSRRVKRPLEFYIKRFAGRMTIIFIGTLLFTAVFSLFYAILSPLVNEWNAFLYGSITWFLVWFVFIVRFKHVFDRLYKGQW